MFDRFVPALWESVEAIIETEIQEAAQVREGEEVVIREVRCCGHTATGKRCPKIAIEGTPYCSDRCAQ